MLKPEDYKGQTPAWCMGCGNFGILNAFKAAVLELGIEAPINSLLSQA